MARAKKVPDDAGAVPATDTAATAAQPRYTPEYMQLVNTFAAALLSSMEPHRAQDEVVRLRIKKAFEVAKLAADVSIEMSQETK